MTVKRHAQKYRFDCSLLDRHFSLDSYQVYLTYGSVNYATHF